MAKIQGYAIQIELLSYSTNHKKKTPTVFKKVLKFYHGGIPDKDCGKELFESLKFHMTESFHMIMSTTYAGD